MFINVYKCLYKWEFGGVNIWMYESLDVGQEVGMMCWYELVGRKLLWDRVIQQSESK